MKKEHKHEEGQQEKEPHFATQWMSDMAEILNETYRKQLDISLDRINRVAKTNISFFTDMLNTYNPGDKKGPHAQREGKVSNYWEHGTKDDKHGQHSRSHHAEKAHVKETGKHKD